MATMKSLTQVGSLVALIALAVVLTVGSVSAFGSITSVEVNGLEAADGSVDVAAFAGETLPVRVFFRATDNATDVRIKAWIAGERDLAVSSERFDVIAGSVYSRLMSVQVPLDLDPSEDLRLEIEVESKRDGTADETTINLAGQRESYLVQILDVNIDTSVSAGESVPVTIVLKNRGRHFAEDTFVRVSIPTLGVEERAFFGDLSPVDQSDPDKEDSAERRMFVDIPSNAPAGLYAVQIDAFNADSETTLIKKINVVSAEADSMVVTSTPRRTFDVGEEATYRITIVNSGNRVRVYELDFQAPAGVTVDAEETVVAIPAGSSRTVEFNVEAEEAGTYDFAVDVTSNGNLVKRSEFVAVANGDGTTEAITGVNTTVLLTIVLAIIFVVLLVVLIVLLTRRPARSEEFGESYY